MNSTILIYKNYNYENIIRNIALKAYKDNSECFDGEELYINFKLKYVEPYREFNDIKDYILRVKEATGLRYQYKGLICINVNEWIHHDDEEYFEIFLKYLYDHQDGKKFVFALEHHSDQASMIYTIMKYFTITIVEMERDKNDKALENKIKIMITSKGAKIKDEAINLIIKEIYQQRKIDLYNDNICETIINGLLDYSNHKMITCDKVTNYMSNNKILFKVMPGGYRDVCKEL